VERTRSVVIVGGGLASASAALALRKRGFEGQVTIVSEEGRPPYERPPLSKAYLRGEASIESALVRPEAEYSSLGIALLSGRRAVTLDAAQRRLNLDDGTDLAYDALLIATGSKARKLDAKGADLGEVRTLRTADDADALREAALQAAAIVVVGGGWIGSEVAASLRQMGRSVTLVTPQPRPLERVLGPEVADAYRDLHLANGVNLVTGRVTELEGNARVESVRLADGRRLAADLVVAGVGAIPRLALALRAGLETTAGGIAVDEHLRSSVPSIYAAGDVAAAWHPRYGRHVRIEHWDNAKRQGAAVAASMLGSDEPYTRTPYFYSDQFDLGMEYRGFAPAWGRVVVRGDLAARAFHAFWLADGRVIAAMNANLWEDGKALARLVDSEERVDLDRLADPNTALEDLIGVAARAA
jgi:3-phenylpropionate/trans-cinnamate dioxygenase ferredoxin reductase component